MRRPKKLSIKYEYTDVKAGSPPTNGKPFVEIYSISMSGQIGWANIHKPEHARKIAKWLLRWADWVEGKK